MTKNYFSWRVLDKKSREIGNFKYRYQILYFIYTIVFSKDVEL